MKYINSLDPYIQQEIEFITIGTLINASYYTIKIDMKLKEKGCFLTKPTSQPFDKIYESTTNFDKSKWSSQNISQNSYQGKKPLKKDKGKNSKQPTTQKWCDYHSSSWHDAY